MNLGALKNLNNHFIPIVLCAGFGKRLRPLTEFVPKTVCPVGPYPVAYRRIKDLLVAGFEEVHCNLHHLGKFAENEIVACLIQDGFKKENVRFWYESEILETGGGIARISHALKSESAAYAEKDLLVCSGDIVGELPLKEMIGAWEKRTKDLDRALMVTKKLFEKRNDVTWISKDESFVLGFGQDLSSGAGTQSCLFTNYQILSHRLVGSVEPIHKSSIDLFYRRILRDGGRVINLTLAPTSSWFDIGTYEKYNECLSSLKPGERFLDSPSTFFVPYQSVLSPVCVSAFACLNLLRQFPVDQSGQSFETILRKLSLLNLAHSPSTQPRPLTLAHSSLIFQLPTLHLSLNHPLLIPLELLAQPSLSSAETELLYSTSQTYFSVT